MKCLDQDSISGVYCEYDDEIENGEICIHCGQKRPGVDVSRWVFWALAVAAIVIGIAFFQGAGLL